MDTQLETIRENAEHVGDLTKLTQIVCEWDEPNKGQCRCAGSWDANPEVVVTTFDVVGENVEKLAEAA